MHNVCVAERAGCVCVRHVYVLTAAFELRAVPINRNCSEMRHESSSAHTAELRDQTLPLY